MSAVTDYDVYACIGERKKMEDTHVVISDLLSYSGVCCPKSFEASLKSLTSHVYSSYNLGLRLANVQLQTSSFLQSIGIQCSSCKHQNESGSTKEELSNTITCLPQVFYLGVFDGHGGDSLARFCKAQMHMFLARLWPLLITDPQLALSLALVQAELSFAETNGIYPTHYTRKILRSILASSVEATRQDSSRLYFNDNVFSSLNEKPCLDAIVTLKRLLLQEILDDCSSVEIKKQNELNDSDKKIKMLVQEESRKNLRRQGSRQISCLSMNSADSSTFVVNQQPNHDFSNDLQDSKNFFNNPSQPFGSYVQEDSLNSPAPEQKTERNNNTSLSPSNNFSIKHRTSLNPSSPLPVPAKPIHAAGSTALIAIIINNILHLAWLGDSEAWLFRQQPLSPQLLSSPHSPLRQDELRRIERIGGIVTRHLNYHGTVIGRINGCLAVSRSLGDNDLKPFVTCRPEVVSVSLTNADEFLVLASDGLWNILNADEVADAIRNHIIKNAQTSNCGLFRCCFRRKTTEAAYSHKLWSLYYPRKTMVKKTRALQYISDLFPTTFTKHRLTATSKTEPIESQDSSQKTKTNTTTLIVYETNNNEGNNRLHFRSLKGVSASIARAAKYKYRQVIRPGAITASAAMDNITILVVALHADNL